MSTANYIIILNPRWRQSTDLQLAPMDIKVSYTTPSKPSATECSGVDGFLESIVEFGNSTILYVKTISWALGFVEMAAIISTSLAPNPQVASLLIKNGDGANPYLTTLSTIGLFLIVSGTPLRMECYRALKNLLTFEVSIRKDHGLFMTWPYNIVRHPSYAGMLAIHIGMYCWCGSRGSWLRELGLLDTLGGRAAVFIFATFEMGVMAGLVARIPVDDAALKKLSGEQWVLWVRQVPYAIIPGVY
ncbi:hypothetical protein DXG01_010404 [Tephrocybe rancida]|nr:hypothetical protein DXG01_010404 [Tephrocybe rancida]